MKILLCSFLTLAACSGPAFEASDDLNPQPELPVASVGASAPEASETAQASAPAPQASAPAPQASEAPDAGALAPRDAEAPVAPAESGSIPGTEPEASNGVVSDGGALAAPPSSDLDAGAPDPTPEVPCILGEADTLEYRVRHSECPDSGPFCQRHAVCGNDEWEPPECSEPGYDFVDVGDNHCTGRCNRWLVCVED